VLVDYWYLESALIVEVNFWLAQLAAASAGRKLLSSTKRYSTDFLCLLADPLGFEDPPPDFPVAERTCRWLDVLGATACFLCRMCPALSPATPSQPPAHAFHR
jgi:hypothetical protein